MRTVRYAIVGFGNVGTALAAHVAERAARLARDHELAFRLVAVADSSGTIADATGLDAAALARRKAAGEPLASLEGAAPSLAPDELMRIGVDCLVDCLPTSLETGEPGLAWARAAFRAGADVVFADKGPLVVALPELEAEARARGRGIGYAAATASALPTLALARRELAGARIREVAGVLNGTSNLILTRMREGLAYADALAEAQRDGIAEPDPRYDVEGWDTAVKLTILARALLDPSATLDRVEREGIDRVAPEAVARAAAEGGRLRLVGRATLGEDGRARVTVAPEVVGPDDAFYVAEGALKAARFVTDDLGELVVLGGASGRGAVAAAMLKDMIALARERAE